MTELSRREAIAGASAIFYPSAAVPARRVRRRGSSAATAAL